MVMLTGTQAALLTLAIIVGVPTAIVYYDRRGRYGKYVRAWRRRISAMADQPFHLRLLTANERRHLVGRHGQTSDEWARTWAADFIAGRRDCQPTCADYLDEFGRHPSVQPAEDRTYVRT
jgi:hypothetical protein